MENHHTDLVINAEYDAVTRSFWASLGKTVVTIALAYFILSWIVSFPIDEFIIGSRYSARTTEIYGTPAIAIKILMAVPWPIFVAISFYSIFRSLQNRNLLPKLYTFTPVGFTDHRANKKYDWKTSTRLKTFPIIIKIAYTFI